LLRNSADCFERTENVVSKTIFPNELCPLSRPDTLSAEFVSTLFSASHFLWALSANSCARSFAVFCFPGSSLSAPIGFLPLKQPLALEAEARALVPQKNGAEKRKNQIIYLYVKWKLGRGLLAGGLAIKHVVRLPGHSRKGGLRRRRRRV